MLNWGAQPLGYSKSCTSECPRDAESGNQSLRNEAKGCRGKLWLVVMSTTNGFYKMLEIKLGYQAKLIEKTKILPFLLGGR